MLTGGGFYFTVRSDCQAAVRPRNVFDDAGARTMALKAASRLPITKPMSGEFIEDVGKTVQRPRENP